MKGFFMVQFTKVEMKGEGIRAEIFHATLQIRF